ncbi:hypothetical protein ACFL37_01865 [Candidatus Margulisiibacteriota bacterium]
MIVIKLILGLSVPLLVGYCLVALILKKGTSSPALERLAWSFGLGTAFLTLTMFFLVLLKVPLTVVSVAVPCFVFVGIALSIILKQRYPVFNLSDLGLARLKTWQARVLFSAIVLKVLYVFFEALIKPVVAWDAWTSWALKSKMFFVDNVPLISFFRDHPVGIVDYPLHIPLLETWLYNCLGVANDQLVKVIFPLYFMCLLIIFYYGLRRLVPGLPALFFTFVLSALPFLAYHATIGYADFPVAFYYTSGLLLLYLWMEKQDKSFLLLSVLFLGVAPWVKKEGILLLSVAFLISFLFLFFKRGTRGFREWGRPLIYFIVPVLISAPWAIFKKIIGISANVDQTPYLPAFDVLVQRLNGISRIFFEKMFFSGNWNIIWLVFVMVAVIYFRKILASNSKYLFLSVFFNLGMLVAIYLFSHNYRYLLDGTTLNRNMLTFIPAVVLCVAVSVSLEVSKKRQEKS